ncbi:MAG: ABC transporter ATP-binding protein [Caulobacteraceae bacterium]
MSAAMELIGVGAQVGGRLVLQGVTLAVQPGEVVGVLGANGCGKTTLLRAALGLISLRAGEARLAGRAVGDLSEAARASLAAYLPQERRVGWNMPAWRVAALGAVRHAPDKAHRLALEALEQLGMSRLAERGIRDMSGGERARVLIARLIAAGAPLILADEPAAGLDPDAQLMVMELLQARAVAGAAVLATLHDLTLAARCCDRVAVLAGGRLIASGTPIEALTPATVAAAFGLEGALVETPAGPVMAVRRRGGYRPPPAAGP